MHIWFWIIVALVAIATAYLLAGRTRFFSRAPSATQEKSVKEEPKAPPAREKTLKSVPKTTRALSKEVELAWEASEIIEFQPGAYSRPAETASTLPAASPGTGVRQGERNYAETYQLPSRYGIDRLVLMPRDPYWLYAYWEITHKKYQEMKEKHLEEWHLSRPILRLSDITPGVPPEQRFLDIFITEEADNWYIHVGRPRHTLFAEIGRLLPHSVFVPFIRSNAVTLPPDSVSDEIAEEWAPIEWSRQYGQYRREIGLSSPWIWGRRP